MRPILAKSLAVLTMFAASPALAEGSELVVTATRLPASAAQTPDVHVVTSDEIALRQANFAFDALTTIPGLQISRTGAFGGVTSLRIRGASSDKTLVLIDGADVNDPTSPAGGFDFASLDLADVDRIEVLSGPQGSLWGSDAIGGVVSITTREPNGLRAVGEGGSLGTVRGTAAAGVSDPGKAFGADVAWTSTDGISKADARDGNTERDGFHSFTAQGNGRLTLSDAVRADGMQMDRVSNSFFGGSLFPFEAKGRRIDLRWTAERTDLGPNAVLLGVERQSAREDTGDGLQTAVNWAGFAIWRFTPSERLTATVSLRRDEPRDYKGVTTVRASAVLGLGGGVSLSGSFGQGFKAPSIYQTSYPCFECTTPGPKSLKPEYATGGDATLGWRSSDGRFNGQVTGYVLSVRDQIDYIYPTGYLNIARTRTTGVEAEAQAELGGGFSLKASYAYADAKDLSTNLPLLRVPAHTGAVELAWRNSKADGALIIRSQSSAADVSGQIRPFTVADLTGSYALSRHVRLTGRIENLTDTHYQEAFGFGEPGIGAFVGVRISD